MEKNLYERGVYIWYYALKKLVQLGPTDRARFRIISILKTTSQFPNTYKR